MLASLLIIVFSLAWLVYFVRHTCLLLVKEAKTDTDMAYPLFSFPHIRTQLRTRAFIASLHEALDRDYAVLTYLIRRAPVGSEARLLVWDYRLMRCWYALTRVALPAQSIGAIAEMADVLSVLADKLRDARSPAL